MSFPDIAKAKGALQRVFPVVDRRPVIDSQSSEGQAPDSRTVRGELELQHVVSHGCQTDENIGKSRGM
jgi:ATP-binding cassette subfamily B (MDR/TAP) protein 1